MNVYLIIFTAGITPVYGLSRLALTQFAADLRAGCEFLCNGEDYPQDIQDGLPVTLNWDHVVGIVAITRIGDVR